MRVARSLVVILALTSPVAADPVIARPTAAADLVKARGDLAAKAYASTLSRFEVGRASVEDVAQWSVRWLDAMLDGAAGRAITTALQAHATRMRDLEDKAVAASNAGRSYASDVDIAQYHRIEADLWVARGKR